MAVAKSTATLLSAVTTTQTSTPAQDISGHYGADLYVSIAVVGTATAGATFQIQWSEDGGTTYYNSPVYTAGLTAGTYYFPPISIPVTVDHIKIVFTQQTGGTSSTCTAQLSWVTAI